MRDHTDRTGQIRMRRARAAALPIVRPDLVFTYAANRVDPHPPSRP
ncbi:hypothetical protein JOF58_000535 [Streptomyces cinnamonensis]|nr:hypothetical protein [Streptomyces virginiae]